MDESWANFVQNFNESLQYLTFSQSLTFGYNEILSDFISFMTKILRFTLIL
jgi:hypothetical protein